MKVLTIMDIGFEELEAVGTIALLKRAGIEVDICSLCGESCTGRYEITLSNLKNFSEIKKEDYELLFVPGGPHFKKLLNNDDALKLISYFTLNKKIAAICAGPTILGKLGLLKEKNYTCFTSMNEDFGGNYIDQYVVKDENIITGRSAAATIDFGFEIINTLLGKEKEIEIKNQIYYNNKSNC